MGSTGLVGQQFIRLLDNHPFFEIAALISSSGSAGKRFSEAADWILGSSAPERVKNIILMEALPETMKSLGIQVVFSALPSQAAREAENTLAEEGFCVFSNADAFRMEADVPILIPEVNADHMELVNVQKRRRRGFIVTNSNCSTTGLVMGLKPLVPFGLKTVTVATYQALSGAGRRGVMSLDILGNVIPFISHEEEKIERETKKILGWIQDGAVVCAPLDVNASCCRVATRDGHLESVVVETEEDVDVEIVSEAFAYFQGIPQRIKLPTAPEKPIILADGPDRPQPILDVEAGAPEHTKGMAVTVGRIRKKGKKINFFLLVHNTIRGAAGTCILNAELAMMEKHIPVLKA